MSTILRFTAHTFIVLLEIYHLILIAILTPEPPRSDSSTSFRSSDPSQSSNIERSSKIIQGQWFSRESLQPRSGITESRPFQDISIRGTIQKSGRCEDVPVLIGAMLCGENRNFTMSQHLSAVILFHSALAGSTINFRQLEKWMTIALTNWHVMRHPLRRPISARYRDSDKEEEIMRQCRALMSHLQFPQRQRLQLILRRRSRGVSERR
jgi:hypothetical protein